MKLEKLYVTYHDVDNTKLRVSTKVYVILSILFTIALAIFAAGIVLLFQENNCQENKEQQDGKSIFFGRIQDLDQYCELSEEAQRINLTALIWKLQRLYFKTFPNEELVHAKDEEINQIARRYDLKHIFYLSAVLVSVVNISETKSVLMFLVFVM